MVLKGKTGKSMVGNFKILLIISVFIGSFGALEANEYCQCLKVTKTPAPTSNLKRYSIQCYVDGKLTQTVEQGIANFGEIQSKIEHYMHFFGIKHGDCIQYPKGMMELAPQKKEP